MSLQGGVKLSVRTGAAGISAEPTWLEEDSVGYFYIPRVAIWLNSVQLAHEWTNNECGGLTNVVK